MRSGLILIILGLFLVTTLQAQVLTGEDSLNAGLSRSNNATVLSGYGEAKVAYDLRMKTGTANLTRNVLFFGHKFSNKIQFFSELELENAKVANGSAQGEISMEQLFLKFTVKRNLYITAGLFIPRMGIINENHLPTTFNGNDRPFVETVVIPSTWRELGIGIYGQFNRIQGLNYSIALVNGLDASGFRLGTGIVGGRFEGSNATASNLAVTGALLYYWRNFRMQVSAYYGGSNGLTKRQADSLKLDYGSFGTPVLVNDANVQYLTQGLKVKVLGAMVNIPDAQKINRAYAHNVAQQYFGAYAEVSYNLFHLLHKSTLKDKSMNVFCRYEYMDLDYKMPANGLHDDFQNKQYLIAGFTYQPVRGVMLKADYVFRSTGMYNQQLYISNPYATVLPFYKDNGFINIGFGYSF